MIIRYSLVGYFIVHGHPDLTRDLGFAPCTPRCPNRPIDLRYFLAMRTKEPIRNVEVHGVFYLDLRYSWVYYWFGILDLPNEYASTYVVQ